MKAARAREKCIQHHLNIEPYMFYCRDTGKTSVYASKASPCIDTHLQDINKHGIMRFINHNRDQDQCNVKFMRLKNHVFVVALKDIGEGEELMINYNNHQNYARGDDKRVDDSNDELVYSDDGSDEDGDDIGDQKDEDKDVQPRCERCTEEMNLDKLASCCFRRKRGKKGASANCPRSCCFKCLGWTKRRSDKVYCHYVSLLSPATALIRMHNLFKCHLRVHS